MFKQEADSNWPYRLVFFKVLLLPIIGGIIFLAGVMLYSWHNTGGIWRGFIERDSIVSVALGGALFFLPSAIAIALVVSGLRLYRSLLTSMSVSIMAAITHFLWWVFCDKYITPSLLVLESVYLLLPLTLAYAATAQLVLPKKEDDLF
ncbi:hypothetical protein AXE65_00240 [Ventosimonas gracilis]|uniref:Uncharacterized protein n=1 Tax=Ventosimonas gracilis TaxID=1680762 RepID=A0A139SVM5_9GAMM|nr:hypothetical protein [Ventosimonas gracilis]KXU38629.1 hypothetical protein AXE65_00240 [Ventosimonas gracilis]